MKAPFPQVDQRIAVGEANEDLRRVFLRVRDNNGATVDDATIGLLSGHLMLSLGCGWVLPQGDLVPVGGGLHYLQLETSEVAAAGPGFVRLDGGFVTGYFAEAAFAIGSLFTAGQTDADLLKWPFVLYDTSGNFAEGAVSVGFVESDNTTGAVLLVPTSAQIEDGLLMVAVVSWNNPTLGGPVGTPAGWTEIRRDEINGGDQGLVSYYRFSSAEPSDYSLTWPDQGGDTCSFTQVYRNVDTGTPITADDFATATNSASITAPSVSILSGDKLLCVMLTEPFFPPTPQTAMFRRVSGQAGASFDATACDDGTTGTRVFDGMDTTNFLIVQSLVLRCDAITPGIEISSNGDALSSESRDIDEAGGGLYFFNGISADAADPSTLSVVITPVASPVNGFSVTIADAGGDDDEEDEDLASAGYFGMYFGPGEIVEVTVVPETPTPVEAPALVAEADLTDHVEAALARLCQFAKAKVNE